MRCFYLSFLGIIFLIHTSFAQEGIPFPTENAVWSELRRAEGTSNLITIHYGIIGDTIINNRQYKKMYTSTDSIFDPSSKDLTYFGGLRISQGEVSVLERGIPDFNENLVYNPSLEVGDTLYDGGIETATFGTILVKSIDSVTLEDGLRRKRWNFEAITSQGVYDSTRVEVKRDSAFSWVEGVGNTKCPFKDPVRCAFRTFFSKLICFEQNGQKIYADIEYPDCYFKSISVSVAKFNIEPTIELFPNPAYNSIFLQSSNSKTLQRLNIKILDTAGRLLREEVINFNGDHEIDISQLPKGAYFIQVSTAPSMETKRVLKTIIKL